MMKNTQINEKKLDYSSLNKEMIEELKILILEKDKTNKINLIFNAIKNAIKTKKIQGIHEASNSFYFFNETLNSNKVYCDFEKILSAFMILENHENYFFDLLEEMNFKLLTEKGWRSLINCSLTLDSTVKNKAITKKLIERYFLNNGSLDALIDYNIDHEERLAPSIFVRCFLKNTMMLLNYLKSMKNSQMIYCIREC